VSRCAVLFMRLTSVPANPPLPRSKAMCWRRPLTITSLNETVSARFEPIRSGVKMIRRLDSISSESRFRTIDRYILSPTRPVAMDSAVTEAALLTLLALPETAAQPNKAAIAMLSFIGG
jgi:hypothetical protein